MAIDDANWVAQPRNKWYHGNYSIPLCLEGVRRCQMRTKHGVILPVPRRYRLQGGHVENTYHDTTPRPTSSVRDELRVLRDSINALALRRSSCVLSAVYVAPSCVHRPHHCRGAHAQQERSLTRSASPSSSRASPPQLLCCSGASSPQLAPQLFFFAAPPAALTTIPITTL